jgi:DNA-binding transcriptional MocR family regulator
LHYTHSLSDAKDWLEKHIKAVTKWIRWKHGMHLWLN